MQEPWENRFCSLLLFEVREINRFLESCHRDPRKILRASRYSILETRASILDSFEDRGSSFESRLSTYICTVLYLHVHSNPIHWDTGGTTETVHINGKSYFKRIHSEWRNLPVLLLLRKLKYCISSNNSRARLFLFSHRKGAIIRGKAIISNISTGRRALNFILSLIKKLITSKINRAWAF